MLMKATILAARFTQLSREADPKAAEQVHCQCPHGHAEVRAPLCTSPPKT